MDCHELEPLLSAWVDGQLPELQGQHVRNHLARCPACWNELQALEQVGAQLTVLKSAEVLPAPEGLLAGVKALPAWLVRLAVLRRWVALAGGVTVTWAAAFLLLCWSDPLTATLTARGSTASQMLSAGMMFTAKASETVDVSLDGGHGVIRLHGPGVLVVREAVVGHVKQNQRLALDLPNGDMTIQFSPQAADHEVRVTTPHAQVRLTGTWVLVSADPATTLIDVLEGSAAVKHRITGQLVELIAGDRAQVQDGHVTIHPIPVEEWLTRKGIVVHDEAATQELSPATQRTSTLTPLWLEE